jgi:hypothetical protein
MRWSLVYLLPQYPYACVTMKDFLALVLCYLALAPVSGAAPAEPRPVSPSGTSPFFAFCMDTYDAKKRTAGEQATMLKDLGYAGCGHLWLEGIETRVKTLSDAGLRLFQVYLRVDLSKPQPLDEERLAAVLPLLKPHKTQLALLILGGKASDTGLDSKAAAIVGRLADMTRPHDVTIVLYPHVNHWLETCGDAVRIAEKVNRPGKVGAMFNLCHWMKGDAERDLGAVLTNASPWLMAVSLSGSDKPDEVRAGKGNFIQPLGEGTNDIGELLKALRAIEYSGPVGLQCWGIRGDAAVHLTRSMEAWKKTEARSDE